MSQKRLCRMESPNETHCAHWDPEPLGPGITRSVLECVRCCAAFATVAHLKALPMHRGRTPRRFAPFARFVEGFVAVALMFAAVPSWAEVALDCDLSQYHALPGLEARVEPQALIVEWRGETDQSLRAELAIEKGCPTLRELAVRRGDGRWSALGRNLKPIVGVTTGIRRTNHGLPETNRWDVFWD